MNGVVAGGTGGGRLMGKKKNPLKQDWGCPDCEARVSYFWKNCPSCGSARPRSN